MLVTCVQCNLKFEKQNHRIKPNSNDFCSKSCSASFNNKGKQRNPPKPRECPNCKIIFYSKIGARKYCSKNCKCAGAKSLNKRPVLIKTTKKILNLDDLIVVNDFHIRELKELINHLLFVELLSPREIAERYNLTNVDFGTFIKHSLGIKLRSRKDAIINQLIKSNKRITNQKQFYKISCQFTFNPYKNTYIPGYELLLKLGIYHPINNPNGMSRDHILSKEYGWLNNISPEIISHPANCQFLTNLENITKNADSHISLDDLLERISIWNNDKSIPINKTIIKLPYVSRTPRFPSQKTKNKIRETNKKYMNITDGIINRRILKSNNIPDNFKRGLTRKPK